MTGSRMKASDTPRDSREGGWSQCLSPCVNGRLEGPRHVRRRPPAGNAGSEPHVGFRDMPRNQARVVEGSALNQGRRWETPCVQKAIYEQALGGNDSRDLAGWSWCRGPA
ncbi:hypothetical protein LIA77_01129 [Sarocladium implicatum]|nr:hypothetical protein LIA77_01129 [Sarocladium implicatum]